MSLQRELGGEAFMLNPSELLFLQTAPQYF